MRDTVTLFLCGDVMTGRGVDQIFAHACPPRIHERYATSALDYVALAERAHGPIPRRAAPAYVWGVLLDVLARAAPDARIVNLETSVTTSEDAAPKGINYRMHPGNVAVLAAAGVDCCVLANNHVLDWGVAGLRETLSSLRAAGIRVAGAGCDLDAAAAPAVLPLGSGGRVLVVAAGAADSGIPAAWAAGAGQAGVHLLRDLSAESAESLGRIVRAHRREGDVVVASIHWGENWGYEIPAEHRRFAHALVERARVDVVHGHSSHHAKAIEVHRGRPILYGCGDLLTDYEGIGGHERYRDDLVLAYLLALDARTGALRGLTMTPLRLRQLRLNHPTPAERGWLCDTLDRECGRFGHRVVQRDARLVLEWA